MSPQAIQKRYFQYFLAKQQTKQRRREPLFKNRKSWILLAAFVLTTSLTAPQSTKAAPLSMDLNRALQIGWYSLRVQNPFGTNYTGLTTIKSYNPANKEFVFANQQGQDVIIKSDDISFIYFRQLPDRSDVNVNAGDIRNIQITPYREFLYDVPPGQLNIQSGTLLLNTRWRMAEQKPFGVSTAISPSEGGTVEQIEIPRRIQLNYLGNHFLVETELVNMVTRRMPEAGGGTIPRPLPTNFPIPAPPMSP
ncbi:MAG: hypothetical protein ACK40D_09285 [Cyanobacteriota bacterium]